VNHVKGGQGRRDSDIVSGAMSFAMIVTGAAVVGIVAAVVASWLGLW
jgi:hypothetical protein